MLIGVDLDEVLADLITSFVNYHNSKYNTSFQKNDFFSYKLWDVLKCSKEDAIQRMYDFFKSPCFNEIQPIKDSKEVLSYLKENHELVIISSRQELVHEDTRGWINYHFPKTFSKIYFSGNFYSQTGDKTKLQICKELNTDLLIEDALEYALECQEETKVLLFDQPWNQSKKLPDNIHRVYSWKDILNYI